MRQGLDWAWGHLAPATLRARGDTFACRYLSYDRGKNISASEAKALSQAGIDIVVVWETTASRALSGYGAGQADAREALRQATAVGKPKGRPIFFAVDFDETPGQAAAVDRYFRGVNSVLGVSGTGAYGGYWVIKRLFDAHRIGYGWQTYAWSGGAWDPRAHLQQFSNAHNVAGVGTDYNRANAADFGQWRVGQVAPPKPRDPYWFLNPEERSWVREFYAIKGSGALQHCARERLLTLMTERRKLIWLRGQDAKGRGWNIVHRRERYHLLQVITKHHGAA